MEQLVENGLTQTRARRSQCPITSSCGEDANPWIGHHEVGLPDCPMATQCTGRAIASCVALSDALRGQASPGGVKTRDIPKTVTTYDSAQRSGVLVVPCSVLSFPVVGADATRQCSEGAASEVLLIRRLPKLRFQPSLSRLQRATPMKFIIRTIALSCAALSLGACGDSHLSVSVPGGGTNGETLRLSFPPGEAVEHRLPFRISGGIRPYESNIEGCPDWVTLFPDQGVLAGVAPVGEGGTHFCTYRVTESDPGFRPARSVTYGLRLEVGEGGSATTSSDPSYHLGTARFTTHQPLVLEQIGAHHAYARGLTGRGVRIGIEDTVVDYTQRPEFGNRIRLSDADGASLVYSRPLGDFPSSDVAACDTDPSCRIWAGNSAGDSEALNRWVQRIVSEDGWPPRDDSVFVLDEHYPQDGSTAQLLRWSEVPTPYGGPGQGGHGTIVASVAAGTNLGVAPEATIIPVAINLTDDQDEDAAALYALQSVIESLPIADRRDLDAAVAREIREDYDKFDIINRSYGARASQLAIAQTDEAVAWYRTNLPRSLRAEWQADRSDSEKTIVVWAAGNDGDPTPALGAGLPYYIPDLRGHSLAVVATDTRTGNIADYSNRCGPLPADWNAVSHGAHYCLAAPGTVRGLVPDRASPGRGRVEAGLTGTSFAAPIVSGALALLMEHFRGTRGNTEIVKRMIDTANRDGHYSDLETYGAGHLDIAAALSPVGSLNAGQSARALSRSSLVTPAAFGSVARRASGIELAAFDAQGFPFWLPLSGLVSARAKSRSPIPQFADREPVDTPAVGLDGLGLQWVGFENAGGIPFLGERNWMVGLDQTSASLARVPRDGEWGYGLSFDDAGYLEAETSGAFGSDLRSGMIWTARTFERDLGKGLTLNAKGTLAFSLPRYQDDAVFSASPSLMSAMSMRIGTETVGLTAEQPLRAESGTGTFRVENGRVENGRRLYDLHRIPLRPDARELRFALRHERMALGGNIAVEVGHSMNVGHVPGESETGFGVAYRMTW